MLMRAQSTTDRIAHLLTTGWWTYRELGALAWCGEDQARLIVHRLGASQLIFRRRRTAVRFHPVEHRIFPQAVQVRAE